MSGKRSIGTAPVRHAGKAIYFTMDGGTFTHGKLSGSFAPTVGGAAVIVYIEGTAYVCKTVDIVKAAVVDFRRRRKAKR